MVNNRQILMLEFDVTMNVYLVSFVVIFRSMEPYLRFLLKIFMTFYENAPLLNPLYCVNCRMKQKTFMYFTVHYAWTVLW